MLISERVDALDVTLFDAISSETLISERTSLLAVQRAIARKHPHYAYLEIGSHLGGSLQPHYLDDRCTDIYSIDPRPEIQPDDRAPGYVCHYEGNSSQRMRELLGKLDRAPLSKLTCFDCIANEVPPDAVSPPPRLAFIDGEHTHESALSDFQFCRNVIAPDGVILFHDSGIVLSAISQASRQLNREGVDHVPLLLGGTVFGIFLDRELIALDDHLSHQLTLHGGETNTLFRKARIRRLVPPAVLPHVRRLLALFRHSNRT